MELRKALKKLIITEPFWGLFLFGINKSFSTQTNTLCVSKSGINLELLINEEFWNTLTDEEQIAVLLHEVHHIAFNHMLLMEDFPNKEKFNIAADLEVNCYINNLPKGAYLVEHFGFPEKKGTKWYYENLPEFPQLPNSNIVDDHSKWKDFEGISDAQKELIQAQIETQLKKTAEQTYKSRGTIPDCLKEKIEELFKDKPRIYDWKAHFRRMLGSHIEVKPRKTYQRESKRFSGLPGHKLKRKVKILVAVDTSGSVSLDELTEFFTEINHIYKAGAIIDVIECDADIQSKWRFEGKQSIQISGRGGTDFKPAVDYYVENKKEYTMFVFFTDGYAPIKDLNAPKDMFWIITSDGNVQDYVGKVIYIPKKLI